MSKASIRESLLQRRRQVSADRCMVLSLEAQERFLALDLFREARSLALYCSIKNEVFTEFIFSRARSLEKRVVYPRVHGDDLAFIETRERADLGHGSFGILEPQGQRSVDVCDLDLLVVPGVAFDRVGHRLGYGRGYYDRALRQAADCCCLIGLCFDFQRVDALPFEPHDVQMDFVVTEAGCYASEQPRRCPG